MIARAAAVGALTALHVLAQPGTAVSAFTNQNGGCHPCASLVLSGKTLYGAGSGGAGGFWGYGTLFKVGTDGQGFAVLHRFTPMSSASPPTNNDGAFPQAGLALSGKTLYGTASEGGSAGSGAIFKINTDGSGFAVLHSFTAGSTNRPINSDGARPMASLIVSGHTLYGTAQRGGNNEGTVFKLNTDGAGFLTLHTFSALGGRDLTNSDGAFPEAELLLLEKTLYGTTWAGGSGGRGTVFKVNTDGTGFATLHSFERGFNNRFGHDGNSDGAWPDAGLVASSDTLYGTAPQGGTAGNGTIFKIRMNGTDFAVLHSFTAIGNTYPDRTNSDGATPHGRLILSGNALYGTASEGGLARNGTVFKIRTDGTGFAAAPSFGGTGLPPAAALVLSGNTFYGTMPFGGSAGGGTVFKVKTNGRAFTVLHSFTALPLPPGLTD